MTPREGRSGALWRRLLLMAASVFAVLGLVTLRVVVAGEQEIAASNAALERGDPREATVRARRAAGWFAPGAPHVSVAYARLVALAEAGEAHKRIDIALLAWRSVRSAAIETRWVVTPHADDLARANREIARLSALDASELEDPGRIEQQQLQELLRHQHPRLVWVVLLVAAFAMGTAGLLWWSRRVAGPAGQLRWAGAKAPLAVTLAAVALWLLAVWRA